MATAVAVQGLEARPWKAGALVKGTVLGGLAMFVWGAISWMALPFRESVLSPFGDEKAMTSMVISNAPRSGMYLLPGHANEAAKEQLFKGPAVFAAVRTGPLASMPILMGTQVLIMMAAAFLGSLLLMQTRPMSYGSRVLFLVGVAGVVAIAGHLPDWNWWSFSTSYTLLECMDLMVGWTLAGLVMAKVVR
jgi:hypothetical protein